MIDFFFLNKILILLVDTLGIWLGFWVYLSNRKARTNQWFTLMIVFALSWITLCYFSGILTNNLGFSLFLGRLAYGAAILFFIPFYFFSVNFIKEEKKFLYLKVFILISSISIFFFSVFTDFMAQYMTPVKFGVVPVLGEGKFAYFGFVFFVSLFIIARLFIKYFKSSKNEKLKLQYFLLGIFIFVIINLIFNVILAFTEGIVRYYQIGNYSAIFLLAFTAYAIVKRHLFGIKVVLTQLLVGLIAVLLLVNVVGSETPFEYIWKGSLLVVFLLFGYLLIKSILREIKQKEEFEKMTVSLQKANVKLKRLDATKTEFIAVASHQLRTPLTAIRGYISLVRHDHYGHIPKKAQDALRLVYQASLRLLNLSNRLLDVSRIQLGKISFNPQPVSLVDLISSVVQELQIQAKEKKLKLVFEKPDQKMPLLSLDVGKIRQVLLNILDNDLKYTQKGGITIYLRSLGGKVRIKIQDTGMGMTPEELGKIFKSFSRGDAGMAFHSAGAGLGLYVAKKFVDLHHGRIWATSPGKGRGSVFWIELPLRLDQAKLKKDLKSFPEGGGEKIP